jgi:plasmid stability protein
MSVTLSIKNAPDAVVARLRARAIRNHRSLQGELLAIIEAAVQEDRRASPLDVLLEARRLGVAAAPDATAIIRNARDGG